MILELVYWVVEEEFRGDGAFIPGIPFIMFGEDETDEFGLAY